MNKSLKFSFVTLSFVFITLAILVSPARAQKKPFTTEDYFNVTSLSGISRRMPAADLTKDGEWYVCVKTKPGDRLPQNHYRYGDPTYIAPYQVDMILINTKSGEQKELLSKKQVRSLTWSSDGRMLAFFILREGQYRLSIWHRTSGKFDDINISRHGAIASNSHLAWSPDGSKLYFSIRAPEWERKSVELFKYATEGPIIVRDSEKPFLLWDEVRSKAGLMIPVVWDRTKKNLTKLLPETPILSVRLSEDGTFMVFERDVTEKTNYEVMGGRTTQPEVLTLPDGSPRVLLKGSYGRRLHWSKDSTMLAYTEKGDVYGMGIDDKEPSKLTEKKEKQHFNVVRFSPDASKLLCTSYEPLPKERQQYWVVASSQKFLLIDVKTGKSELVYEFPEERQPKLQLVDWSPDGQFLYFSYSASDKYDRGLVKLDLKTKKMSDLIRSDHLYRQWRMSENGRMFLFTDSDGDNPDEWYTADAKFSKIKKLTDLNPQLKDKALSHTELISYRDSDGRKLYGVLYYPANYREGKRYPLVTEVYEKFFDNGYNGKLNILTGAGYAVLHPSVHLIQGYPWEAYVKGALCGINKVIEMGVADPDRLGVQGGSYGGYATVELIALSDRFKAAVNRAGKVNQVSFYTQSPRMGTRNILSSPVGQDRMGGTLWEYPERFIANSAIMYADRIKTPLLCLTGDQDTNVESLQSQEIYYALRLLGRKVVWVRYHNGPHAGPHTVEEEKDMNSRILEWYNKYLKY